jgi:xylulokinase
MTISDLFTFALTGERAGDASTAAFLKLYDLAGRAWWPEALAAFGLDAEKLSTPLIPGTPCGQTVERAMEHLGLPAGIPFAVGALDHHAAAIGSGVGLFADTSISTGTVLAALALVDKPDPMPSCHHGPHIDGRRYYRLAFDPAGAGRLEDYQRRFAPDRDIEYLLALAAEAPAGGRPQIGAEKERTDSELGAEFRQLLEEIAASHRTLMRLAAGAAPGRIAATGGGARSPLLLQIDADTLNAPIVTSVCPERACLGAAAFAAAAAGWYSGAAEAAGDLVKPARIYQPNPEGVAACAARTEIFDT